MKPYLRQDSTFTVGTPKAKIESHLKLPDLPPLVICEFQLDSSQVVTAVGMQATNAGVRRPGYEATRGIGFSF